MEDWLMYLIILAAIVIGWWLGRREWNPGKKRGFNLFSRREHREEPLLSRDYYQGLNYLLNEQPDQAIATFIHSLEVNSNTIETHLALGSLLRRRGEVDKALTVHQNLLTGTQLERAVRQDVQVELVRDYLLAGLLDRAEELLLDLIPEGGQVQITSLILLVEIYQQEHEWQKAIEVVSQLRALGNVTQQTNVAHFYCELADLCLHTGDLQAAKKHVRSALFEDENCVRASLLLGTVEYDSGNYAGAISALQKIRSQDPALVPISCELLRDCYAESGEDQQGYRDYLSLCLQEIPAISIVLALAGSIRAEKGDEAVSRFIAEHLKKNPRIRGLTQLIDLHIDNAHGVAKENLAILRSFTEALVADKPAYRCEECGFSGKKLHWMCPGCKQWGTVEPIYGLEGE
ncbi:MAG: lipopolysaccharide assembly protein LapB [Gammaproteobacteria bacterium]|nr:lipopolysaccharide assembly protein LapB [Gammaproteobacteria bacterium]